MEPPANYSLEECDLECAGDCLSLLSLFKSENFHQRKSLARLVDTCSSLRCNCYYSEVKNEPCNRECKSSCVHKDAPISSMERCMQETCFCLEEKTME